MVLAIPFNLLFYVCVHNNLNPAGSLGMDWAAFQFFTVGKSEKRRRDRDAVVGNSAALSPPVKCRCGEHWQCLRPGRTKKKMELYWKSGWQEGDFLCNHVRFTLFNSQHNIQFLKLKCLKIINFEVRATVFAASGLLLWMVTFGMPIFQWAFNLLWKERDKCHLSETTLGFSSKNQG